MYQTVCSIISNLFIQLTTKDSSVTPKAVVMLTCYTNGVKPGASQKTCVVGVGLYLDLLECSRYAAIRTDSYSECKGVVEALVCHKNKGTNIRQPCSYHMYSVHRISMLHASYSIKLSWSCDNPRMELADLSEILDNESELVEVPLVVD